MALQSHAIESRLEDLRLDSRRAMYDSKLRAARRDNQSHIPANHLSPPIPTRQVEPDKPIDQVLVMLEELSRRIDGLEKNNRSLGQEIRNRGRQDRRWRSTTLAGALAFSVFVYLGGLWHWF